MWFNRLKVRTRIYLGFGVLVALSLGLVGFGVYQLSGIGVQVGKMDALAGNTERVLVATRELEAIRRAETRYLLDAADSALKDARDNATESRALMVDAGQATLSEERRRRYRDVQDTLDAHTRLLEQFVQLTKTYAEERGKLFSGGDALTAAADKLVAAARASSDPAVAAAAAAVERGALLVRVANWRFMATLDKAGPATFKTNAAKAGEAIDKLAGVVGPDVKALIAPVHAALAAYETSFTAYAAARLAAQDLYDNQMRPQIEAMQALLDKAATSLKQGFDGSRAVASGVISDASLLEEALAGIALIVGGGLALLIGRGIVRPPLA